ncbi:hypothetical protein [Corynebacterium freiburgense]|uniref:hypothetical protein n=1 Tax=Corynebacterium freiburgense TaxID=556548 RepID=UPI000420F509|nr:hypothetical protein [Corynebacterium freiburgense]WJZ03429.1 hypothetical protein CFREI_10785 [Corynebacterium freiburgense]
MKNLGRFVPLVGALGGLVLLAVGGTALAGGTAEPKIDPKPVTFKVTTTPSKTEETITNEPEPTVEPSQEVIPDPQPADNYQQQPAPPPPAAPPPAPPPLPPLPQIDIHIPPFVPPVIFDDDDFDDEDD